MKQFITILFLFLFSYSIFPQNTQTNDWIRVQSDNGEFSIEVPKKYNYFYSDKGVSPISEVQLNQMNLLTAFDQDTLISIESYKESKSTLSQLYDRDKYELDKEELKANKIERNGTSINQFSRKHQDYYIVRQYFSSKDYIYILTAASRKGETQSIKRFFDSLLFDSKKTTAEPNIQKFSNLLVSAIEIVSKNVQSADPKELLIPKNATKDSLLTIFKPRPSFTQSAKQERTQGSVQLRIFCLETGFINKIEIVSSLPNGLTWQVISSVIRSKFLPQEQNGIPVSSQGVTEYKFSIG